MLAATCFAGVLIFAAGAAIFSTVLDAGTDIFFAAVDLGFFDADTAGSAFFGVAFLATGATVAFGDLDLTAEVLLVAGLLFCTTMLSPHQIAKVGQSETLMAVMILVRVLPVNKFELIFDARCSTD